MKTSLLFSIVSILLLAGVAIKKASSETKELSPLELMNIEALASAEHPEPGDIIDCYKTISSKEYLSNKVSILGEGTFVTFCGTCEATFCNSYTDPSRCTY